MKRLCNEIYVLFYKWIQLEIKLNIKELKEMFALLLNGDKRYIRYCPESIEKDIFILEKILSNSDPKYNQMLLSFIYCCIDLYSYDSIKEHKKIIQMDMLYYKSVISQYFVIKFLDGNLNPSKFNSFKNEFYQIGTIIKQYYEIKEDDKKKAIKNILTSKVTEMFNRYDFAYSLPPCCL